MENKIYALSNCTTWHRIQKDIEVPEDLNVLDIKFDNITEEDLDEAARQLGSYEAVFSKRALKYKSMGLNKQKLSEADYKRHILEEYTFLKRPVAFINGKVFAGNTKEVVEGMKSAIHG